MRTVDSTKLNKIFEYLNESEYFNAGHIWLNITRYITTDGMYRVTICVFDDPDKEEIFWIVA
jgi:hypothetical protein